MKDKSSNINMSELLSSTYLSEFLSGYLDMTSGDFVYTDDFTKNGVEKFTTMLENLTYSDMLINYSKNKELSSFLFHTISEFENEGDTVVTAMIDEQIISSTLSDIYVTNIGEFIIDQISSYPLKNQIIMKNLLYNNFVISETSPFNGPHTIPNGSIINAYKVTGSNGKIDEISANKVDSLTKDDMVVMRIKNWWSNTAYCSGQMKIRQKDPITIENYTKNPLFLKLFNTISNFDHVERVKGLFKYQQNDIKKSNIYSLRLTNSGLNPANDISQEAYQSTLYDMENKYYNVEGQYSKGTVHCFHKAPLGTYKKYNATLKKDTHYIKLFHCYDCTQGTKEATKPIAPIYNEQTLEYEEGADITICPICGSSNVTNDEIYIPVYDDYEDTLQVNDSNYPYGTDVTRTYEGYRYNPHLKGYFQRLCMSLDKANGDWDIGEYEKRISMIETIPYRQDESTIDSYNYIIDGVYVRSTSGQIEVWNKKVDYTNTDSYIYNYGKMLNDLRTVND